MPSSLEGPSRTPPPSSPAVATDTWDHSRQYAVYMGTTLLGTSNLEYPMVPRARIAGRFLPTSACAHVTWVFQLYSRAVAADDRAMLKEYVTERDRLRLELWDSGVRVDAVVELISTWADETHIVHVSGSDGRLWRSRLHPD